MTNMANCATLFMFSMCLLAAKSFQSDFTQTKKCDVTRKLEVVPGRGWDNLRNKDMGQVLKLSYEMCKITEDGTYLLPDHVSTIAIKDSKLELMSEFIEHYSDYTSITAKSFKTEASASFGVIASVSASFSTDYQNAKQHQVDDKSMTTRVHVRNTVYQVLAEPSAELDPGLKAVLLEAADYIENNNTKKAQLVMELIVRDYGTHFLSHVDAGAILVQEDYVSSQFVQDNQEKKNKICAAASGSFLSKFSFGVSYNQSVDTKIDQFYKDNVTYSHLRAYGGMLPEPNMSIHQWNEQTVNNLVATDRSGEPLSYIITPQKFTNVSLQTLDKVRLLLDGAIDDYYSFNTHAGCMKMDSPNFEYNANVDDNSCHSSCNNYTFGGIYQTCVTTDWFWDDDFDFICRPFLQTNPLTGDTSCPSGYEAIPMHSGYFNYILTKCHEECYYNFLWEECDLVCPTFQITSRYDTFWCAAQGSVEENSGVMFGGLFAATSKNIITQAHNCPPTYVALLAGLNLKVCISNDYELGFKYSVPFGGFFSCSHGNILAHTNKHNGIRITPEDDPYPHTCPGGHSQHMATIDDNCEINYCVKANSFSVHGDVPIVRPPFQNLSALYVPTENNLTLPFAQQQSSALSGGSIAGIVTGCIVVLVSVVLGTVLLRRRRAVKSDAPNDNDNDNDNEPLLEDNDREPLVPEGPQYGSVNDTVISVSPEV